jgi:hypothetical protein
MIKRYIFITLGAAAIGLVVFGIYKELNKSKQSIVAGVAERQKVAAVIPVWLKTNKDVLKIQDELNTLADYRAEYGCLTNAPSDVPQCEHYNQRFDQQFAILQDTVHKLQIENKSPTAIAAAIANIKVLAEDQSLQVRLIDIKDNPYSNNGKNVDIYQDNKGIEYMVDVATNKVVELTFEPTPPQEAPYKMTPQISQAQQRQKAEIYLAKHVSDFSQIKSSGNFTYTESSKGNKIAAFRWDSNIKLPGGDMAPFIQVVMSPAGDVMSFNDTRSLYQ